MQRVKLRRNCWYGPQVSRLRQCRRWENRQLSQRWTLSMQPECNICGFLLSKWKWSSLWKRVNIFSPNANWQNTKYLWNGGSPGRGHEGQSSNLDSNWCWGERKSDGGSLKMNILFLLLRSKILPGFENPQRANVVIATAREDKAAWNLCCCILKTLQSYNWEIFNWKLFSSAPDKS